MKLNCWLLFVCISIGLSGCVLQEEEPKVQEEVHRINKAELHNPKAARINTRLGVTYLQQGDNDRAKMKLLLAQKQDPKSPEVMGAIAYFFERTGEPDDAKRYYLSAILLDPTKGESLNNYGAFLCRQGEFDLAEQHFMLAVKDQRYSSPGEAYENAGLCALKNNKVESAQTYFVKALQKQPQLPNALIELAKISYDRGEIVRSNGYLRRYARVHKPTARSLGLGIRVAQEMGDNATLRKNVALLKDEFPYSKEYKEYVRTGNVA